MDLVRKEGGGGVGGGVGGGSKNSANPWPLGNFGHTHQAIRKKTVFLCQKVRHAFGVIRNVGQPFFSMYFCLENVKVSECVAPPRHYRVCCS